jgi:hypothetical protein
VRIACVRKSDLIFTYHPGDKNRGENPGAVVASLAEVEGPHEAGLLENDAATCHLLLQLQHLIGHPQPQTVLHLAAHPLQRVELQALVPEIGVTLLGSLHRHREIGAAQTNAHSNQHLQLNKSNLIKPYDVVDECDSS